MTPNSRKNGLETTGDITPELRQLIRQRRRRLGITVQQLSGVLRVNCSTLRKWEDGDVQHCRPHHIYRLARFLAGEYDSTLQGMNVPAALHWEHPSGNAPMLSCMERIITLFCQCERYPEVGQRMLDGLQCVLVGMVERLVPRGNLPCEKHQEEFE